MLDALGPPDSVTELGPWRIEVWRIARHPLETVVHRTFSKPGGPVIDVNKVGGMDGTRRVVVASEPR